MRTSEKPTITKSSYGGADSHEEYRHPAYGTIEMSVTHGGTQTLFGSDLGHNDRVSIRINTAKLVRNLSNDWIHSQGQLIEFDMSHAQFAQFIVSQGKGGGTPVTLRWIRGEGSLPEIIKDESKHDTFRREVRETAKRRIEQIEQMEQSIQSLEILCDATGSVSKKDLRAITKNLKHNVSGLPGTLHFIIEQAEEALEKATSDAKIEVESYIQMAVSRIGLKHISDIAKIEQGEAQRVIPVPTVTTE